MNVKRTALTFREVTEITLTKKELKGGLLEEGYLGED